MKIKKISTRKEYFEIVDLADDIFIRRGIRKQELIKLTITKLPDKIMPVLIKYTINDGECFSFLRDAKRYVRIVFQDKSNVNQS